MKKTLRKISLFFLVLFLISVNFLFFAQYVISPCDSIEKKQTPSPLCNFKNFILAINNTIGSDNAFVGIVGGIDVVAIGVVAGWAWNKLSAKRPFKRPLAKVKLS